MRSRVPRSANDGFTLPELGAVVAVILLAAMLFLPAFAQGKGSSAELRCMNNAKQLVFAAQLYAGDNQDLWPANGLSDISVNFSQPPARYVPRVWAEGREPSNISSQEAADGMISEKFSLLAEYVADKKTFLCPEDRSPIRSGNRTFQRSKSYGMNLFVGWTPDRVTAATWHGEPNARSQIFTKTSSPAKPGGIFVFGEIHPFSVCHPAFGTHPRWDTKGNPTGENRVFHLPGNNHGRSTVFSMADGHSEIRRWIHRRFNDPYSNGRPLPEADPFWHTHDLPLPGVTSGEVARDFKWLTAHTTVPK